MDMQPKSASSSDLLYSVHFVKDIEKKKFTVSQILPIIFFLSVLK